MGEGPEEGIVDMPKAGQRRDPAVERLDRVIELLEDLVMLAGKRYGLGRDELRGIVKLDAKRVSRVTKNVVVPE